MRLPEDTNILLSLINTKLRDCPGGLGALCKREGLDRARVEGRLKEIGYVYRGGRFVHRAVQ